MEMETVGTRKGSNIADRLLDLGAAVIRVLRTLPADVVGKHIGLQVVRAATSGGANYEEARAAESRADFVHKVGLAAKELRESVYWLRLIQRTSLTSADVAPLVKETEELVSILVASARTARRNGP